MDNLSQKGLIQKAIFQKFAPGSIQALIDGTDAVTVALRVGRTLLAWLDRDNRLQVNEIDGVC